MRTVFVDTWFWLAQTNKHDQHHLAAMQALSRLGNARLVTTDEVLTEFLAAMSTKGTTLRKTAAKAVRLLLVREDVEVLPQSRQTFLDGLALYEQRLDKEYSLTDCTSMESMRQNNLTEILTQDHHFTQAGFILIA